MSQGWIKLHRSFLKWEWWDKPEMVHLFIHFLLLANHKKRKWRGQTVYPGQFITGLESLSEQTGISRQTLRTCIKRLKSTGEITNISTNRFRLITIVNWEQYQVRDNELTSKSTGKLTNNQHTTNKQLTANKNVKKEKNTVAYNNSKAIQTLRESKQKHIRLIGWYFNERGSNFPDQQAMNAEIKRWAKDAAHIAKWDKDKIFKAFELAKKKHPDLWKLSTIKKYISEIK